MVNFSINLTGSGGAQIFWLNTILGVSVRVFQDEINIWSMDEKSRLPSPVVGVPHPIQGRVRPKGWWTENCLSLLSLSWDLGLLLPSDLDWNLYHLLCGVSGLWDWRSWDFSASRTAQANPLLINLPISPICSVSLENPNTPTSPFKRC